MKRNTLLGSGIVLAGLLVSCGGGSGTQDTTADTTAAPAAGPTEASVDLSNAGTVTGTIAFSGEDTDRPLDLGGDPTCLDLHEGEVMSETIVGEDGGLGNVFVYVKSGLEGETFPVPADDAVLDQSGCMYAPHVLGVMAGQGLVIRNSDPTLHNVHARPSANREFNAGQPIPGMETRKVFDQVELNVPFKCDVHPWMSATVHVVANPYHAVSGSNGSFSLEALPPGDYVLEAVHETLGTREATVTVPANGTVEVQFDFDAAA